MRDDWQDLTNGLAFTGRDNPRSSFRGERASGEVPLPRFAGSRLSTVFKVVLAFALLIVIFFLMAMEASK